MSLNFAKNLRKKQTDAEKLLWYHLRSRHFIGFKFRRQYLIGPYIVDFVCLHRQLIIELDGGQHMEQQDYDEERTNYLMSLGYRVLRFWNNEVFQNIDGVMEKIYQALLD